MKQIVMHNIDYNNMNMRQALEALEGNFDIVTEEFSSLGGEIYKDSFSDEGSVNFTLTREIDESTEVVVFKNGELLGTGVQGTGYTISNGVLTVDIALVSGDNLSVYYLVDAFIAGANKQYSEYIKELYDKSTELFDKCTKLNESMESIASTSDTILNKILNASEEAQKSISDKTNEAVNTVEETLGGAQALITTIENGKSYIQNLLDGKTISSGDLGAEILAARRGFTLLGERMDYSVIKFESEGEFRAAEWLRNGDSVVVMTDDCGTFYNVRDAIVEGSQYINLKNNLYGILSCHFLSTTEDEDIELEEDETEGIVMLQGTDSDPVIITELQDGFYKINGVYREIPSGENKQGVVYLWLSIEDTASRKLFYINTGKEIRVYGCDKITKEYTLVNRGFGNSDITGIGDGTLTGAITEIYKRLKEVNNE